MLLTRAFHTLALTRCQHVPSAPPSLSPLLPTSARALRASSFRDDSRSLALPRVLLTTHTCAHVVRTSVSPFASSLSPLAVGIWRSTFATKSAHRYRTARLPLHTRCLGDDTAARYAAADRANRAATSSLAQWLVARAPARVQPYLRLARLDKPIGTWLLLWPGYWSLALVHAPPSMFLLFGVGAFVMRGAGCTINDMWDRDIDRQVARTRDRPLASGAVSMRGAWIFLAAQLSVGLAILLSLNALTIQIGCAAMLGATLYPLAKRVLAWPQAVLALVFNIGALMAYSAATGHIGAAAVELYLAGIAWTMFYDTIYAHMDKTDDARIKMRSTALASAKHPLRFLAVSSLLMSANLFLVATTTLDPVRPWAMLSASAIASAHMFWQLWTVRLDDAESCMQKFVSNRSLGALVGAACLVAGWPASAV